uniref:Uncharacterized protein n=1 Tax=Arundo donax TaxID=35708 RepID=A0A0A9DC84_ARUDO
MTRKKTIHPPNNKLQKQTEPPECQKKPWMAWDSQI